VKTAGWEPTRPARVTATVFDEPEPLGVWHKITESLIHAVELYTVSDSDADTDGDSIELAAPKFSP
jgi:hypothetical protein